MNKGISHNGITFRIEDWKPWKKLPVLTVRFDGEAETYKVASFKDEATAQWFAEICDEFFKGIVRT